jgi:hypothetical protein
MTSAIKPKWTIASVNWDSFEFIKYQLKYFHEFSEDFEFIIHDNENVLIEHKILKKLKQNIHRSKLYIQHGKVEVEEHTE